MLNNCGPGGSPPNAATMLGVLQDTGLVTAIEVDKCPAIRHTHEGLKETEKTQADAACLADNYKALAGKLSEKNEANKKTTMLGVVDCKCPRKYAPSRERRSRSCAMRPRSVG